ncbi:MAG: hypothetical protein VKJ44_06140 [Synechococcus sp.]|nr:hypothetical protein [Synechococcus sp.]
MNPHPSPAAAGWSQGSEPIRVPLPLALLPLLPLALALLAALAPVQRQRLLLPDRDRALLSPPFHLEAGGLGGARIQLRAELLPNSSMELQLDLLDAAGRVELQLQQQGWRERGRWSEDGESGSYDEAQADLLLLLRPRHSGMHRLRLQLTDHRDAAGQPLSGPLALQLEVRNHSVDGPLLLITALTGAVLVGTLQASLAASCRLRRRRRVEGEQLGLRLPLGGPGLVRLRLRGRYGPAAKPTASPPRPIVKVPLQLRLRDARGRSLLEQELLLPLQRLGDGEGGPWQVERILHLSLAQPTSVGVWARLAPRPAEAALELEWLELMVEDGVRPRQPLPVAALS